MLFNFYQKAAEHIVSREEAVEAEIAALEADLAQVKILRSDTWKWLLTIVMFFMYFIRNRDYDARIAAISEKIDEKRKEHDDIFRDYKVTALGVAYVPVARQVAYDNKCFVVDYSGAVGNSTLSLQLSRQNDLLVNISVFRKLGFRSLGIFKVSFHNVAAARIKDARNGIWIR